ncbi:DUF4433 domain-containing protein [Luethyella okanaganae]|uniref:DUF4433 domain-containing protein n=1 Tax=Luethyella okanaganae TaxID=69372 RepID=A0ABW1VH59_9MICO
MGSTPARRTVRARPVSLREARPASGSGSVRSAAQAQLDVAELRIYHITHIDNLPGILRVGGLLANADEPAGANPAVDISSQDSRETRRAARIAAHDLSVAGFVPFFLSPNASVWDSIRGGHEDPRLTAEALGYAASEFVILVSTVRQAIEARPGEGTASATFAVTDGDATGSLTRFAATRLESERMLRRLRVDEEADAILGAEVLICESFPFDRVGLIGVANDKVREAVKRVLQTAGYKQKVAVYPPWFQSAEETSSPL